MQSLQVAKSFQGLLVLQTLAAYLRDVDSVNNATYDLIGKKESHGALILAVTAVSTCLYDKHSTI